MQLVEIYQLIYLALVTIFSIYQINLYKRISSKPGNNNVHGFPVLILMIFLILLIGLRPPEDVWFADSYWYYFRYRALEGVPFVFNIKATNFIWDNLFDFFCAKSLGISNLFLLSDILYFGCTFIACRKLFPKDYAAAYLVFLGAFSTFSYSYNGIKAGIAASIFILALAYRKKLILSLVFVLISLGFHHSMQLPVVAFLIVLLYKNPKIYFIGWVICLLMALLHVSYFQNLFASMSDERGSKYLALDGGDWGGVSGLRLDFILYSAMPIWVAYIAIYKKGLKLSNLYTIILDIYLITNSVWMLCMYARFTNRIAYLSWFLYPIVLIYPFLNEKWGPTRYKTFSKVMAYQLAFTLFMQLIYYKILKY